ncbi:hypothetical protein [Parasediminibacterium sp. JCM 36343]|uniref:hypothetical protein n=1 Tax=Parasediminibacterium sp. JCM 36343 TaxID=3374279 RepID=UPI00397C1C16
MKKCTKILPLLFCLLALAAATKTNAQTAPSIQWQKAIGGTGNDVAQSIQHTADGGYIVAGYTSSNNGEVSGNNGGTDCWVIKLDGAGNLQWQKTFGGSGLDYARSIQPTADGGYIIAGFTGSNDGDVSGNHRDGDCWVVKLDSSGNLQWQKAIGGAGLDEAYSIQTTADNGYIIAGKTTSNDSDGTHGVDCWVVKLGSTGGLQWQKTFGGTGEDVAKIIKPTADGGYIMAGYTESNNGDISSNHGEGDAWVVKLDSMGILQWQKTFGGTSDDGATSIFPTADGSYVMAGYTGSKDGDVSGNHGGYDYWVIKLSSKGILQWQNTFGGTGDDKANTLQPTDDGGYIVAGYSLTTSINGNVSGNGGADYRVAKLDSTGSLQWQKALGGTTDDYAYSVQPTSDGGYIV